MNGSFLAQWSSVISGTVTPGQGLLVTAGASIVVTILIQIARSSRMRKHGWKNGGRQAMDKICGQWRIDMLDWWLFGIKLKLPRRFWWWFRNVKLIWQNTDGSIQGCNILWGWRKWGEFDVADQEIEVSHELFGQYIFEYKHFRDYVSLDGDKADGNLFVMDKRRATFTMTRIVPAIDK